MKLDTFKYKVPTHTSGLFPIRVGRDNRLPLRRSGHSLCNINMHQHFHTYSSTASTLHLGLVCAIFYLFSLYINWMTTTTWLFKILRECGICPNFILLCLQLYMEYCQKGHCPLWHSKGVIWESHSKNINKIFNNICQFSLNLGHTVHTRTYL